MKLSEETEESLFGQLLAYLMEKTKNYNLTFDVMLPVMEKWYARPSNVKFVDMQSASLYLQKAADKELSIILQTT